MCAAAAQNTGDCHAAKKPYRLWIHDGSMCTWMHPPWAHKIPRTARQFRPRLAVFYRCCLRKLCSFVLSGRPIAPSLPQKVQVAVCIQDADPFVPRFTVQMGTLFMLYSSIAHVIQKVYKIFINFLSNPRRASPAVYVPDEESFFCSLRDATCKAGKDLL